MGDKQMIEKNYVEVDLEILGETEKALRVSDGEIKCWIAKSMIQNYEEGDWDVGDTEMMVIPEWLAENEGLV
jgi:hypothetical protein